MLNKLISCKLLELFGSDNLNSEDIQHMFHVIDTDVVVISGSLIDGTGTPTSDFDISLIAQQPDERFDAMTFPRDHHMRYYTIKNRVKATFDYLPGSLLGLDVEYHLYDEVENMIRNLNSLYDMLRNRARKYSSFSATGIDSRLLSRLSYGVPLKSIDIFHDLRDSLDTQKLCYVAYRTAVGSYPDFRDLVGLWIEGDYDTGLWMARKLCNDNMRGLTHLYGNTNINGKYLPRIVSKLPDEIAQVRSRFLELYQADLSVCGDSRSAIIEWLDLLDQIFNEIRLKRDTNPYFPSRPEYIDLLRKELHSKMQWHVEIENEYAFRAKEVLNDMPRAIDLILKRNLNDDLPFRKWAKQTAVVPTGENQQVYFSPR